MTMFSRRRQLFRTPEFITPILPPLTMGDVVISPNGLWESVTVKGSFVPEDEIKVFVQERTKRIGWNIAGQDWDGRDVFTWRVVRRIGKYDDEKE